MTIANMTQRVVAVLVIVLARLLASDALAADQWWDTGTAAGIQAGSSTWDTNVAAWAPSSGGATSLAVWTNGNNAWFSTSYSGANTALVNGVTVNQLLFSGSSGANYLNAGSGALNLTSNLLYYGCGSGFFNTDINLASNGVWLVQNGQLYVNGRINGPSATITKAGYSDLSVSNVTPNSLAGCTILNGSITILNWGTPLGTGPITLGGLQAFNSVGGVSEQWNGAPYLTISSPTANQTTTFGDLIVKSGALSMGAPANITNTVNFGTLTRSGNGALFFQQSGAGKRSVFFSGGTTLVNGILPPWIFGGDFMTYSSASGMMNVTYASSFNPAISTQVVYTGSSTSLAASQTSYAFRAYFNALDLNGKTLTLGDGALAGLSLDNGQITNGQANGSLIFNAAEALVWCGRSGTLIATPIGGSAYLNLNGTVAGATLTISNSALYGGGPISVSGVPQGLNLTLWPTADVTLNNGLTITAGGKITKDGACALTLRGTNVINSAGTLAVNAGALVLSGATSTNNGTVNVGGSAATLSLTNSAGMPGSVTVNVGPAAGNNGNVLQLTDSSLGSAPYTPAWNIGATAGAISNKLTATRSQLACGALTVGNQTSNNTVAVTGPNAFWTFNGKNVFVGFGYGGNGMLVDGGGAAGGAVLTNINVLDVGYENTANQHSIGNSLVITNGGQVYPQNSLTVGYYASGANASCDSNSLTVTSSGSLLDAANQNVAIGGPSASNNALTVANGAQTLRIATLTVGGSSTNNSALVSGGGLLEATALIAGPGAGNSISNMGGVFQFTTANPTITPNRPANTIAITNGVISFRGINNADVKANWNNTLTNISFAGNNAFRLNNATNVATGQAYTFAVGLGATNYTRLELLNGSLYRGGDVTIGTNGSLLVSNGASTIGGNVTFDPTATLSVDLSSTNNYGVLVAQSNVTLSGCALNISLGSAPVPGSSFMIISNAVGYTTNSFATNSQWVAVNGTNYLLRVHTSASGATVTCNLLTTGTRIILL